MIKAFASLSLLCLAAAAAHADGMPNPPSNQVVNVQGVLRNQVDIAGDVNMQGSSLATTINVRAFFPYNSAAAYCPMGSVPIYTPRRYLGKTGAEICAADTRKKTTCTSARFAWVGSDNTNGTYPHDDHDCATPLPFAWPWGQDYNEPDSLAGEWGHGNTWVVCCQ